MTRVGEEENRIKGVIEGEGSKKKRMEGAKRDGKLKKKAAWKRLCSRESSGENDRKKTKTRTINHLPQHSDCPIIATIKRHGG